MGLVGYERCIMKQERLDKNEKMKNGKAQTNGRTKQNGDFTNHYILNQKVR